jgi:hypothetical protein
LALHEVDAITNFTRDASQSANDQDQSLKVLVLYLERPEHNVSYLHAISGRFGYNDLKEAAPVWGYAL